jgi:2-polyprenyl-3-methyl-5-hydroxy-6-metoxy-1,4-benzoquinol methylase
VTGPAHVDDEIVRSWSANADAWTQVVRSGLIPNRKAGTDAAIIAACTSLDAGPVLDVGCGEGWLVRALGERGVAATGVDVSVPLIARAAEAGGGTFVAATYAQLEMDPTVVAGPWRGIVCNFALLGDPLHPLLAALRARLVPSGSILIQTVHPWTSRGDVPYLSQWRTESFDGFGISFPSPMPWFYRTFASWYEQLALGGLHVVRLDEPLHPTTGAPLSLVFHCEAM